MDVTMTVNGVQRTVSTDPERPLLDVLREDLHLTGANGTAVPKPFMSIGLRSSEFRP